MPSLRASRAPQGELGGRGSGSLGAGIGRALPPRAFPRANGRSGALRRLPPRSRGALLAAAAGRERRHLLLRPTPLAGRRFRSRLRERVPDSRGRVRLFPADGDGEATQQLQHRTRSAVASCLPPRPRARSPRSLPADGLRLPLFHRRRHGDGDRRIRGSGFRLSPSPQPFRGERSPSGDAPRLARDVPRLVHGLRALDVPRLRDGERLGSAPAGAAGSAGSPGLSPRGSRFGNRRPRPLAERGVRTRGSRGRSLEARKTERTGF